MTQLVWQKLLGQEKVKEVLGTAFERGALGHAYLFCGERGAGTFAAALELVMALLCTDTSKKPCYTCDSCRKVLHFSHPDFHVIMPVSLSKEHRGSDGKLSTDGWSFLSQTVSERISDPYRIPRYDGIPSIPVEWVRETNHAILRGSVIENGHNVVIMDGVDTMSVESANAMLKTLEEPPAGTIMILITDRIHTVLPTLISRCQIVRFAYHRPELIAAELAKRFNRDETDPHIRAAATANTLGDALVLMEEPDEEVTQLAIELWDSMGNRNWDSIAQKIDSLAAMDNQGFYEKLFLELARLIRNAFLQSIGRAENYFTPEPAKFNLQSFRTPEVVETLLQLCQDAIGSVRVFGNISLISINFVISIMELSDGQK